jgi:hypothetical protein
MDLFPERHIKIATAVLIDRRGVVRYISVGVSMGELEDLQSMIEKLLKEPAP